MSRYENGIKEQSFREVAFFMPWEMLIKCVRGIKAGLGGVERRVRMGEKKWEKGGIGCGLGVD